MEYKIFDMNKGLMSDDEIVIADTPLKAVKTIYPNAQRDYSGKIGNLVVSGQGRSYVYIAEPPKE